MDSPDSLFPCFQWQQVMNKIILKDSVVIKLFFLTLYTSLFLFCFFNIWYLSVNSILSCSNFFCVPVISVEFRRFFPGGISVVTVRGGGSFQCSREECPPWATTWIQHCQSYPPDIYNAYIACVWVSIIFYNSSWGPILL